MKKLLFLITIAGILLGVLYVFFVVFPKRYKKNDTLPVQNDFPAPPRAGSTSIPPGDRDTIFVRSIRGDKISVRDFRKDALVEIFTGSNYTHYILRDTDSPATAAYEILYSADDGGIIVSLREEPLRETRLMAETALIQHLGVSREKLCDLSISVSVARDVNEFYAGKKLGISNCQGSQPL